MKVWLIVNMHKKNEYISDFTCLLGYIWGVCLCFYHDLTPLWRNNLWKFFQQSEVDKIHLGGGFKHFLFSPRTLGKISNLTCAYFSDGLVQPPTCKLIPNSGTSWSFLPSTANFWTRRCPFCIPKYPRTGLFVGIRPTVFLTSKSLPNFWGSSWNIGFQVIQVVTRRTIP